VQLTHAEWSAILREIHNLPDVTIRLTRAQPNDTDPPNASLYDVIEHAVPNPNGWAWTDSWLAYVCAILEHEGSVELYAGLLGRGVPPAKIVLRRD
jgi:hypothetical protein